MGSVSLPVAAWIAAGATVAGTAASAYESHEAGVAQSGQDKAKARQESLSAAQKQITQRQNMLRALATQNANAGQGGIGTGGGFGANVNRQLQEGQQDLLVTQAGASANISMLDYAAGNAMSQGNIGAGGDILNGISKVAGAIPGSAPSSGGPSVGASG